MAIGDRKPGARRDASQTATRELREETGIDATAYGGVVDWGFLRSGATYRKWTMQRHGLRPGQQLLDVACGTGLVAVAAQKILGGAETITCVDPSEGMMAVAKRKLPARFVVGRAEQLPFPDDSFDFLTMGYALRHVLALEDAFREYRRVLKPGGKVLIMEVTKPAGPIGRFVSSHPTVKMLALAFLFVIGVALIAEGFDRTVPKGYIYFAMAFSVAVEMLNLRRSRKTTARPVDLRERYVRERPPER